MQKSWSSESEDMKMKQVKSKGLLPISQCTMAKYEWSLPDKAKVSQCLHPGRRLPGEGLAPDAGHGSGGGTQGGDPCMVGEQAAAPGGRRQAQQQRAAAAHHAGTGAGLDGLGRKGTGGAWIQLVFMSQGAFGQGCSHLLSPVESACT